MSFFFHLTIACGLLLCGFTLDLRAQNRCLTQEEAARAIATISSPLPSADVKTFRKEVVNMAKEQSKLADAILNDLAKNESRVPELNRMAEANLLHICQLIKQNGWQGKKSLNDEAFGALNYLIANGKVPDLQRELVPVLVEAGKKGDIGKPMLADIVDSIRLGSGYPQIFGTQATRKGDLIYILPLLSDDKVDEWRKAYDLPPLANQIRILEARYMLPVLKSQRLSSANGSAKADVTPLGLADSDADIKIETNIVNLNVRVFTRDLKSPLGVTLTKDDFTIIEDGVEQETEFFSSESAPFDLVLVLDFSGSTTDKRSLIKKAAKRFIEVARPEDRVAVIVFADEVKVGSDLTSDKAALYKAIDKVNIEGGSAVWDSLKFAFQNILSGKTPEHRSAVVFMTDGYDNASKTPYADAVETVRHGDTTVFSVFVNTLNAKPSQKNWEGRLVTKLQSSLSLLSEESGGQFYVANDLKDLNGIYEQVISDIGRIYSLGYESKNENRDGGWRGVGVKLKKQADLIVKTRHGYYAN